MKGCICLDIDGTLTADPFSIPKAVWQCLEELYAQGWQFLFSTGRPYAFTAPLFVDAPFPFFLSLQNGADLLEMPQKKLLAQHHLSSLFIPQLEALYEDLEEDFLIYAGFSRGDFCYYRPDKFSVHMLEYLERVKSLVQEPWQAKEDFIFSSSESFPLMKGVGTKKQMEELQKRLQAFSNVHASCISDPISKENLYLNLITSALATKAESLKKIRELLPSGAFFIAAGNDRNDIPMLLEADLAIVMKNAPEELWPLGDILAEPAIDQGIINALFKAIQEVKC